MFESIIEFFSENPIFLIFIFLAILPLLGDSISDLFDFIVDFWFVTIPIIAAIIAAIAYPYIGITAILLWIIVTVGIIIAAFILDREDSRISSGYYDSYSEYEDDDDDQGYEEEGEPEEEPARRYEPSSVKTGVRLNDIKGLDEAKHAIQYRVIMPLENPEVYAKFNVKVGGGVLLYGLPGTGKTMFAQAVATELDADFFEIKCSDLLSKWYGESESNVKALFEEAGRCKRSVIFFDEFEAIGRSRTSDSKGDAPSIVPELLAQIQGFQGRKNLMLLLAATNRPWDIDSALLRPGRFNERIYIPLPDYESRLAIIKSQLKGLPVATDVQLEDLSRMTDGFNGADVVEFCEQLKMGPVTRMIEKHSKMEIITKGDVEHAREKVRSTVLQEDVDRMERFRAGSL